MLTCVEEDAEASGGPACPPEEPLASPLLLLQPGGEPSSLLAGPAWVPGSGADSHPHGPYQEDFSVLPVMQCQVLRPGCGPGQVVRGGR